MFVPAVAGVRRLPRRGEAEVVVPAADSRVRFIPTRSHD
jgi:hypothetical protein